MSALVTYTWFGVTRTKEEALKFAKEITSGRYISINHRGSGKTKMAQEMMGLLKEDFENHEETQE